MLKYIKKSSGFALIEQPEVVTCADPLQYIYHYKSKNYELIIKKKQKKIENIWSECKNYIILQFQSYRGVAVENVCRG